MQYNYQTQQLLDKGVNFATIYPEKQSVVKEMTGFDFDLVSIVSFLKKETDNFTILLPLALEIDKNIVSIYNKYQVSQGKKAEEPKAEPIPEPPKKEEPKDERPSVEILTGRLKLIKKMYAKNPSVVLKGRIKIIEKMLTQPEKFCCGGKMVSGGTSEEMQEELSKIERFLNKSSVPFDDWEWDGKELKVYLDEELAETYSREDLREADVIMAEGGKLRRYSISGAVKMFTGGYVGKTAEQVWKEWNSGQRQHFLIDHNDRKQFTPASIEDISKKAYNFIPEYYKNELEKHVTMGQYSTGGELKTELKRLNDELAKTERGTPERMEVLGKINMLKHNNPELKERFDGGGGIGVVSVVRYRFGEYREEESINKSELADMIVLGDELDGFDIREEDQGKQFFAYENDIDGDDEDGYSVKDAYAVSIEDTEGLPQFSKGGKLQGKKNSKGGKITYKITKETRGKASHYSVEEFKDGKSVKATGFDTKKEAEDYISGNTIEGFHKVAKASKIVKNLSKVKKGDNNPIGKSFTFKIGKKEGSVYYNADSDCIVLDYDGDDDDISLDGFKKLVK